MIADGRPAREIKQELALMRKNATPPLLFVTRLAAGGRVTRRLGGRHDADPG
jgi:hypothetical protein